MSEKKDTLVFQGRRRKLVEELSASGLFSEKVLKAIGSVPRHLFVQKGLEDLAYKDMPVAIEAGQTISQPSTVAFQTQLLDFKPGDRILEIGTGCGYQTAVLFYLGAEVFSIERQEELFRKATENLTEAGYIFPEEDFSVSKIHLFLGDGFEGLKDLAPFDGIIVTCGAPALPKALMKQLSPGGKMVIPVDEPGQEKASEKKQILKVITRKPDGKFTGRDVSRMSFVPMLKGVEKTERKI
ncbi:MAG: protein-L-isoaspartate(D-aspartate) O-methyltransferase [Bacteroidales bacterium]|jgi:protein-L-isoaspartate(D-aspartate) O-methyltransferase|nr:protein-L-isoaspartate(D-aspartate) O-methyltransferase [Bacteroidales bacterium]MBR0314180.1 protein-L-isoaspartate(D-aspartate) O-methyltransferase [Bacteroidales bacterium]